MTTLSRGATWLSSSRDARRGPIPASRVDPVAEDDGLLMWVRFGDLAVGFDDRPVVHASIGQAVWVPPGLRHSVELTAGSVAVPLLLERTSATAWPSTPTVLSVPDDWSDWILHRLSRWFGFASGFSGDGQHPADLLAGVRIETPALLPPLPRSAAARAVVERLLRDPACPAELDELAADAHVSRRTLQRRLAQETGHSLAQWRTAVRVDAAARYLAQGRALEWVAHRVGYATLSSFTHAFSARTGVSPGRYAERHARPVPGHDGLVEPHVVAGPPPSIPAAPASPWMTSFDGVLWVARGTARVSGAGQRRELQRGDVVWLGRGVAHEIEIDADSVVLPLGLKAGGPPVRAGSLKVVHLPHDEATELFWLHTVVANHFLLRPKGHDDQAFLDLLEPVLPVPQALPPHVAELVAALVDEPADRRSLTAWAADLGVDPVTLRRDFARGLGAPFPQWRATARMTLARAMLWDGRTPTEVGRRLGYAHLSGFSKAFSQAYGVSPREWLRREAA